jgi:hypothetical protein
MRADNRADRRLSLLVLVLIAGCASRTEELSSNRRVEKAGVAEGMTVGAVAVTISGYQHTLAASRIHLGAGIKSDHFGFMQRWSGSDGTFAINDFSGMALGLQASLSPAYTAPPYSGGFQGHNDAVRSYFLSAGIPADQVLGVGGASKAMQTGSPSGPPSTLTIVGYESTVARSVGGFHVSESFAEAQINVNNEVVRESVYWPPLPGYLLDDATKIVADSTAGPTFLSTLPIQGATTVAIHHTSGHLSAGTQFVAFASVDVQEAPGESVHHFDVSGNELFTPEEARRPPDASSRTAP